MHRQGGCFISAGDEMRLACHDVVVREPAGKLLTVLLWACVVVAVPLVGVRWVDSSAGMVAVLQAVEPMTGFAVAVLVLIAAATRRWRITLASTALLTVCATIAAPSLLDDTVAASREDLVVMSANMEYGGADAQSLVSAVRDHRVDVLMLIEITPAAVERLRVAGLHSLLPESAGRPSQDAGGTIIRSRSRVTLVESRREDLPPRAFDQPVVLMHREAGDVMLRAVHSRPPSPFAVTGWRAGLADLQAWRDGQPVGLPLVMAGDYNSSWGHPGFRRIAETMTDAHRAAGEGWVRTWPQGRRLIRPFIQPDHVLVQGMGVVAAGVVHLPGTDHAAVWARLSPREP